jgi:hypothetical protein
MKKILALIAILSFATLGQAVPIVKHVSGPTAVIDPVTLATLDAYVLSLESTDGGKITAVDLDFAGPLMQIMFWKPAFGSNPHYTPTPLLDTATWPPEYLAVDSHFLLSAGDVVFGAAVADENLTEASSFRDPDDVWHGPGTYLKTGAMGLKEPVQGVTVALARIVIAHGADPRTVTGIGEVATNGPGVTDPYQLPTFYIPEPATMMLLLGGSLLGLSRRRK